MKKLSQKKARANLDKILTEFCQSINPDIERVYMGKDTMFSDIDDIVIEYSLLATDATDEIFVKNCYLINDNVHCDKFLLFMLHEVGHSMTMDDFSQKKMDAYMKRVAELEAMPVLTADMMWEYVNMPVERAATEWAMNYLNAHTDELAEIWNTKIQPAIFDFYRACGLDEEYLQPI